MKFDPHQMPLMYDKEKFHIARGESKAKNFLYADGHIKNLLAIEGTIKPHPVIQLKNLYKKFGQRLAVDDLTLQVPAGEIYGLLGHNGAGKSTAIGMMLGQVWPTSGDVRICGHDVTAHRQLALQKVGAIFESPAFYDYLSGWRNLEILSSYTAPTSRQRIRGGHRVGRPDRAGAFQGAGPIRTACGRGWRWPRRCCPSRSCSSWTSRATGWTRRASTRCGRPSCGCIASWG